MFASYAKEQQAQLDILRARLADAEAGKVELPEPATLDALYEREVARQRATDEGGASSADEFATAAGEAIRETPDLMHVDDAGNVRPRSVERRVGTECSCTFRSPCSQDH